MRSGNTCGEKDLIQRARETRHGASGISTCPIRMATSCRLRVRSSIRKWLSTPANVSRFPVDLALLREDNALTLKIPPLDATGHSSDTLPFFLG